jgi:hypothetical protein
MGFEFVALADHNKVTRASLPGILVIGQEHGRSSTESSARGHMVGLNVSSCPSPGASPQRRINRMASEGGLVFLSHPDTEGAWPLAVLRSLRNYVGIEIYNCNHEECAVRKWDHLLSSGKMSWGFAVDDAHYLDQFGKGWVVVKLPGEVTTRKVLTALRNGSFYSSQGPTVTEIVVEEGAIRLRAEGADTIVFRGHGGRVLQKTRGSAAAYTPTGEEGYVRAELVNSATRKHAWLQPMTVARTPPVKPIPEPSRAARGPEGLASASASPTHGVPRPIR